MLRPRPYLSAFVLALGSLSASGNPVLAQSSAASAAPNDYDDPATWLCRPGRKDACTLDLTTTVVASDGSLTLEEWAANPDASVDCFYVYPTVSRDRAENSDMDAGPGENGVVRSQLARFGSTCRLFAPLYRQYTLAALTARLSGNARETNPNLGYTDVVDAWRHYLEHDNDGRGIILNALELAADHTTLFDRPARLPVF